MKSFHRTLAIVSLCGALQFGIGSFTNPIYATPTRSTPFSMPSASAKFVAGDVANAVVGYAFGVAAGFRSIADAAGAYLRSAFCSHLEMVEAGSKPDGARLAGGA